MFPRPRVTILVVALILGVFLVYVPLQLRPLDTQLGDTLRSVLSYSGALLFVAGMVLSFSGTYYLVRRGDGTLFLLKPPQRLVVAGPYAYLQHPILLGGLIMLLGEALWLSSPSVGLYATGVALLSHVYVVYVEEPRLTQKFGMDYRAYRCAVPRWVPQLPMARDSTPY